MAERFFSQITFSRGAMTHFRKPKPFPNEYDFTLALHILGCLCCHRITLLVRRPNNDNGLTVAENAYFLQLFELSTGEMASCPLAQNILTQVNHFSSKLTTSFLQTALVIKPSILQIFPYSKSEISQLTD